jgi:hypothetical protein
MASKKRRPGKRCRVRLQAMMKPNTRFTSDASSDAPKLSRSEASTRGSVTTSQKRSGLSSVVRMNAADSGINTTSDRYSMV